MCEHYLAAGALCALSTNSMRVIEDARSTFEAAELRERGADLRLRLWVDDTDRAQPPWPKPYVRGLDHLVFASFDEGSSMLVDLRSRRVIGRFSPAMAADLTYWQTVIFPMLLTIVSASVGIAELHCACVAREQHGVLLAGPSGAGKSTLAIALSQQGFGFLSDDRTFCFIENGDVQAWGAPAPLKLRPAATQWFSELREDQLTNMRSGGPAFWLEPEHVFGVARVRQCQPTSLIFLSRRDSPEFQLSSMSSTEAMSRLNADLMTELPDAAVRRSESIKKLAELPCWLLQYSGQPHSIARRLSLHLARA